MISFEIVRPGQPAEALQLSDDTSFALEIDSPLFSTGEIAGTKVYNFRVKDNPVNRRLTDFISMMAVVPTEPSYQAHMYLYNQLYRVGRLVARSTTDDSIELSFSTDAGALSSVLNTKLSALDLGVYPLRYQHDLQYPDAAYALPVVENQAFYGGENPEFAGYLNYFKEGNRRNVAENKHALVPFPFLRQVFKGIEKLTGYTITGSWLDEEDVKKLIVVNQTALDQKSFRLNVFNNLVKLSNHLPDITAGNLLVAIKDLFGLGVFVNPKTRSIMFRRLDEIINDSYYREFSHRAGKAFEKLPRPSAGYRLQMQPDSADDIFRNTEYNYLSYQVGAGAEEIPVNASVPLVETRQDRLSPGRNWTIPHLSQKGYSEAFNVLGKSNALRLLYYNGMQPDSFGQLFPSASYQTAKSSLHWEGPYGLYERGYKRWLQALSASFEIERSMLFSTDDLLSLDLGDKLRIEGQKMLIKKIRLNIRKTDTRLREAQVTFVRIPF